MKTVPHLAFPLSFIPESIFLMYNDLWFLMKIGHYLLHSWGFSSFTGLGFTPVRILPNSKWGVTSARLSDVHSTSHCFSFPTVCLTGFSKSLHFTGSFYSQGSYTNRLTCWKLSLHNLRVPTLKDYPDRRKMWCDYLSQRFTLTTFSDERRAESSVRE